MTWNYRVLRHPDGALALHEVYYDASGRPDRYTAVPVSFAVDADEGLTGLIASLERALNDARERPILDVEYLRAENIISRYRTTLQDLAAGDVKTETMAAYQRSVQEFGPLYKKLADNNDSCAATEAEAREGSENLITDVADDSDALSGGRRHKTAKDDP